MHLMKMLLALFFMLSTFISCHRSEANMPPPDFTKSKTLYNVSYGSDSLQRMDIYLPAGRHEDSTRSIILIHGGGWNGGSKSEFDSYIDSFKKRIPDYALFNVDYRLVNGINLFPTQENDIRSAIDYIVGHAREFGVHVDRFILLGASAGAHLALLQAYKNKFPKISAVIDFFGPTDLVSMYQKPWHPLVPYALQMVTGATPASNYDLYRQSSPVHYINAKTPPTLMFHGGKDHIVDVSQARLLKEKLEQAGVTHELILYKSEGHGWRGATLTNSFDHVENFLKNKVGP